ncbi:hypothetical protein AB0H12_22405 [Actinosynnema sp. NPDC023794]
MAADGRGRPYFVEEMWPATNDGGVAAALRGPSTVTVKVADGTPVTITEDTAYPFGDNHHRPGGATRTWPDRRPTTCGGCCRRGGISA